MTRCWRGTALLDEARRNVATARVGSALLVVVVALGVGAGTVLEATDARRARTQLAAQVTDGGWVTVARAAPGIDAGTCRRLARQRGVLGAGGFAKPSSASLTSAPGTLFPAYDATPELLDVLSARRPAAAEPGVVGVGSALARELGLVDGSHVVVQPQEHVVVVVLASSMRTDRFSRALVRPAPLRTVDECWVEWVPGTADARTLTESLLAADSRLDISSTLTSSAYATDPFALYATRWTRWWFVPVGMVLSLVMLVALRSRSRTMALYAAVGTDRWELATLFGIEVALVATAGAVGGLLWGLAAVARGGEITSADVGNAVRGAAFVPACVTLVSTLAVAIRRVRVAQQLKAE
jgi:hypothetical protein